MHHALPDNYYIGNFSLWGGQQTNSIYMFCNKVEGVAPNRTGYPTDYQLLHTMLPNETLSRIYTFNNILIIETSKDVYYCLYVDGTYTVNNSTSNIPFLNSVTTCETFKYNKGIEVINNNFFDNLNSGNSNPFSISDATGKYYKDRADATETDLYSGYVFYILV